MKMKKGLRKELHRRELTEWGCQLLATRNTKEDADAFQGDFILQAIEANGCFCGGALFDDKVNVVVELGKMSDDPDAKLSKVTAWLESRPDIENWTAGPLLDLWHGDYEDKGEPSALGIL